VPALFLGLKDEAARLTRRWDQVLADCYRNGDIMQPGMTNLGNHGETDADLKALDKSSLSLHGLA